MARTGNADRGHCLTYAEAGQRFEDSPEAARQLARRGGWQRRTPEQVLVATWQRSYPSGQIQTEGIVGIEARPGFDALHDAPSVSFVPAEQRN